MPAEIRGEAKPVAAALSYFRSKNVKVFENIIHDGGK